MYYPLKYRRLKLLFAKLSTAIGIVTCLLYPTSIVREPLQPQPEDFEITYNKILFQAEHHFCVMPEARAVVVKPEEILNALNLPNGTQFNKDLAKFGECRAKLMKLKKNLHLCSCKQQVVYVIMILASLSSVGLQLSQIFLGLWKRSNIDCSIMAYLSALMWLFIACLAVTYHTVWYDEIWLPDALYAQSYFQRPFLWSVAVGLCFVYFLFAAIEVVLFYPRESDSKRRRRPSQTEKEKENKNKAKQKDFEIEDSLRGHSNVNFVPPEPLPQPKLANAELTPSKPKMSTTWP